MSQKLVGQVTRTQLNMSQGQVEHVAGTKVEHVRRVQLNMSQGLDCLEEDIASCSKLDKDDKKSLVTMLKKTLSTKTTTMKPCETLSKRNCHIQVYMSIHHTQNGNKCLNDVLSCREQDSCSDACREQQEATFTVHTARNPYLRGKLISLSRLAGMRLFLPSLFYHFKKCSIKKIIPPFPPVK